MKTVALLLSSAGSVQHSTNRPRFRVLSKHCSRGILAIKMESDNAEFRVAVVTNSCMAAVQAVEKFSMTKKGHHLPWIL